MGEITRVLFALIVRVGADLAKIVIQVHAVDRTGRRVVARAIKREQFLAWSAQLPEGLGPNTVRIRPVLRVYP